MIYTVEMLTLKAECQALINTANSEKGDDAYRRTGLVRQNDSAATTSMDIESGLAAVTSELAALATILAGLPPGPVYQDNLVKQRKAEYKKFLLEQRMENYGPIARVAREFDIARIDQNIAESDAFIAVLTTHMDSLPA